MAPARGSVLAEEKASAPWLAAGYVRIMQGAGSRCGGTVERGVQGSQLQVISGVRKARELVVGACSWLLGGGGSGDWFQLCLSSSKFRRRDTQQRAGRATACPTQTSKLQIYYVCTSACTRNYHDVCEAAPWQHTLVVTIEAAVCETQSCCESAALRCPPPPLARGAGNARA